MYRRDDEKLHYRDGEQAEHFSASQGEEQAGFSAQDGSEDGEDSCRRAGDVPGFWSRAADEDVGYFSSKEEFPPAQRRGLQRSPSCNPIPEQLRDAFFSTS